MDFKKDFGLNVPLKTTTQATYDWRSDDNHYFQAVATNFAYGPYNLNTGSTQNAYSNDGKFITYGYLVNQTIEYGDLAGISVGVRSDYSSEFGFNTNGQSPKPFTFPRATAFFNPSQLLNIQFLTNWKIRGAYGQAGIQPFNYARQSVLGTQLYGTTPGLYDLSTVRNPSLTVQTSTETEIGTDFTITPNSSSSWFSKIDVSLTSWSRKNQNIIQTANQSPSSGALGQVSNQISLSSTGVDLSVDLTVFKSDNFSWNFGTRYGTAQTTVDKIAQNLPVPYGIPQFNAFLIQQGTPLGIFEGNYVVSSLTQKDSEGNLFLTDATGYSVAKTLYGSVVVNNTTHAPVISSGGEQKNLGNPQPKFFGSIINDFRIFKNIQINAQLDFMVGQKIYNLTRQWLYRDAISHDFDYAFDVNGTTGAWFNTYAGLYNTIQPLSWYVEDGSFARLRNLSITYNLGKAVTGKWAKNVSLTFAGRNLFTITNYRGMDPESVTNGATVAGNAQGSSSFFQSAPSGPARGIDTFGFPNLKSYQFSINLGL